MKPNHAELPIEADFLDPRSESLDEWHALREFLGRTSDQAEAMFRRNFLCYQEDLTHMRGPAFRFYVLPAINYLLSDHASGDSNAASGFCYVLESRLRTAPGDLTKVANVVVDAIEKILANFKRFNCQPKIYGDLRTRYRNVAARLTGRDRPARRTQKTGQ